MNLLQIVRQARFEVDAIRSGGTTSALWSDEECNTAVNTAMDRAARVIRLADSDLLSRSIESDDSAIDLIAESYDPSSFRLVDDTSDYTLPPDFVRVISLRPITADFEGVRFRPSRVNRKDFVDQRSIRNSDLSSIRGSDVTYAYALIGPRTIRFAPTPQDTIDLELVYQFRPPKLISYTTGTVTVTNASTAITGASTDWLVYGLRDPAELVVGATTVTVDRYYPRVSSVTSATAATFQRTYQGTTAPGQTYALAMVPRLPDEHHAWLAQMAAAIMMRKVNPELSDKLAGVLEKQLMEDVRPELDMRQAQESLIVEPFELP